MVFREHLPLNLEQVLGVAEVRAELIGDLVLRRHSVRENPHPRVEDGILFVDLVERDSAVVCVDGRFHRVTDVRDLLAGQQRPVFWSTLSSRSPSRELRCA